MRLNPWHGAALTLGLLTVWARPAAARDFDGIYTECGLGGLLMQNSPGLASCTNFTWDSGTTAISSNISSPDTCSGGRGRRVSFIHGAYPLLENEIARGNGKNLTTLLALSGCKDSARADVTRVLRKDFAALLGDPGYGSQTRYERARALYERLQERLVSDFAESCVAG
ncbi:MAG: DUF3015 family protein [Elusimicrobia bacterium]|nr:DUF3015 family protein [Elusimicrobiota bacterium]